MNTINHIFALAESLQITADELFGQFFPNQPPNQRTDIPQGGLFELTPLFDNLSGAHNKTTLTSSDQGLLRMISHALALHAKKYVVSFIGESAENDPQFTYFNQNSQKNILIKIQLAEQIHRTPTAKDSANSIRLGALRRDLPAARCYLADSELLFFNINALKWSDSPAQSGNNPSGLSSEEGNQLAYMAGQSHKNKFFILYGFDHPERDNYHLSLNSAMQLLWYYQQGAMDKAQPWPIPEGQFQDFTIESAMSSRSLLFRKDRLSGNWFHKIPFELPAGIADHQWIASSHDEYLASANEDLPDRLLAWYELLESN